jgi:hypothetical protein
MDELMDLIIADESPSEISDGIKNVLYAKSAERVEGSRPNAAAALFADQEEDEVEYDDAASAEYEVNGETGDYESEGEI